MRYIDKEKNKEYQKQWRKTSKNHIKLYLLKTKLKRSVQNKKWRKLNKEHLQNYREKNKEHHKKSNINWIKKNKLHFKKYHRNYKFNKEKTNVEFKLVNRLRTRIYLACKSKKAKNNFKFNEYIGCSILDLKNHLQSKFKLGMSWKNYGKWHVDHIRPCSSFDLSNKKDQQMCFHYKNLQPLWAIDNIQKGDKYERTN